MLVAVGFVALFILALLPVRKPKAGSTEWQRERGEALYRHCWYTVKREHPEYSPSQRIKAAQELMGRLEAQRSAEFRAPATAGDDLPGPAENR